MKNVSLRDVTSIPGASGSPIRSGVTTCNYSGNGYKSILNCETHRLQEFEESCGLLLRIHEAEGQCIAVFSWGAISLPGDLASRLHELIGRKIGLLRLDGYHIREIGGENNGTG